MTTRRSSAVRINPVARAKKARAIGSRRESGLSFTDGRSVSYEKYSDVGGRGVNEDTVGVREVERRDGLGLCVVMADGLGGHGGGDVASAAATELILKGWTPEAGKDGLASLLEEGNQAVRNLQSATTDMRTTAAVLSLAGGRALWANAGDSRLYHFRDGTLAFQTIDHSVSQMAVVLGQITPDQIRGHEDRSRLLKALGQSGALEPDTGELELSDGWDAFLLCSDGFWEFVLEDEMTSTLAAASSPGDWLERMRVIRDERAPADCDNNSAVVVWLDRA